MGNEPKLLIFYISRSKVKGQGHKSGIKCLFEPFLINRGRHEADGGWVGSGGVLLAACQLFFGSVPKAIKQRRMPYRMVSYCWQVATVIGNVPIPASDCFSYFSPQEESFGQVEYIFYNSDSELIM